MATSSSNAWLHTSLLSPSPHHQSAQHALYTADLSMHPSSHRHMDLGHDSQHQPCGSFCNPHECPLNLEFHRSVDSHQLHDFSRPAGGSCSGHVGLGGENGGPVSARKVHKADREKLRRDRLNEQFAELAGVLDPDRPKNDKATILSDSVQVVRELQSEVKRLRTEQDSLLDESRDLAQEKTELREEKAALKSETEQLQAQLHQRLRLMLPWMPMDPSMMMGGAPFGFPIPIPQPLPASSPSDMNQSAPPVSLPQSIPTPAFIPLPPAAPGAFTLHPAMQAYPMYGNRPGEVSTTYLPYPPYPSQMPSHSHVERPYPQYPSPVQPVPGYLLQMQPHQGQPPMSGPSPAPSVYQPFTQSMGQMPSRTPGTQANLQTRGLNAQPAPSFGHYIPSGMQPYLAHPGSMPSGQTTLQLLTPSHPQPQRPLTVNPVDVPDGSTKAQSGVTGSASGPRKESHSAVQDPKLNNSTSGSSMTPISVVLYDSPADNQGEFSGWCSRDKGGTQQNDQPSEDPTLRSAAA